MKRYLWLILLFAWVGITWAGGPIGPEQSYYPPQDTMMPIEDGLTWAQIFYYTAGGLAGLAVAIKTAMVFMKRRKKNGSG